MEIDLTSKVISITPTLDTAAYAAGDQLGSLQEVAGALADSSGTGKLVSVVVLDKAKQSLALDVLLFREQPTVTSVDNAALDLSDTEMEKCIGTIRVATTDYAALNVNSVASVKNINLMLHAVKGSNNTTGTSLWMILMAQGAPTYAANSLIVKLGIAQD